MKPTESEFPNDRTESERRKNLTDKQVKELELAGGTEGGMQAGSAGGTEGGMQAGSAGGPAQEDAEQGSRKSDVRPDEANRRGPR